MSKIYLSSLIGCLWLMNINTSIGQDKAKIVLDLDVVNLSIYTFENNEDSFISSIELENISDNHIGIDTHYLNRFVNKDIAIISIGGADPSYHNPINYFSIAQNGRYNLLFEFPMNVRYLQINLILESDVNSIRSELFQRKIDYEVNFGLDGQYQLIFDSNSFFKTKSFKNYRIMNIPLKQSLSDSIKVIVNGSIFNRKRK